MNLSDLNPPVIELPKNQVWFRIQRTKARTDSVRARGFILPPPGILSGRFDLADEVTAYLADSEVTSVYESAFRREARDYPLARLKERALTSFRSTKVLRLVDLRSLEERYPVLQSLRYELTQAFASDARSLEVDGIAYSSAQHPHHSCFCLFERGVARMMRIDTIPLVEPGSGRIHRAVVEAAHGSMVRIT